MQKEKKPILIIPQRKRDGVKIVKIPLELIIEWEREKERIEKDRRRRNGSLIINEPGDREAI